MQYDSRTRVFVESDEHILHLCARMLAASKSNTKDDVYARLSGIKLKHGKIATFRQIKYVFLKFTSITRIHTFAICQDQTVLQTVSPNFPISELSLVASSSALC